MYSGRSDWSRIAATIGATAAAGLDPTLGRREVEALDRRAHRELEHRDGVLDERLHGRVALAWRSSHGSMPVGSTATKDCDDHFWSSANARIAAFCPAASPSKVKMTSAGARSASSRMMRRSILMWSAPKAVPHVATAVSTPARWQAMTSV